MFYYFIYILLLVFSLSELITIPRSLKIGGFFTVILVFILIGGLRWNTGSDWRPYFSFYTKFNSDNPIFMLSMEPGFANFVRFLRIFSDNFTFYLFALSTITIGLKALYFYRFTGALSLALLLYWCLHLADVVAVRQALAVSICAVSTLFIVQNRPFQFVLTVILAAQIHVTAYIFIFAYYIYNVNWTVRNKYIVLAIAVTFGLTVGSETILQQAINIIPDGFGLDRMSQKAERYMELGSELADGQKVSTVQRTFMAVLKRAIILPVFFVFQNRITNSNNYYNGFLNLYTFGNVLYFVFIDFLTLQRTAGYFYFFEIILFCLIFENSKSKFIWLTIVASYSLSKLIAIIMGASDLLIPYIWIFSKDTYRFIY